MDEKCPIYRTAGFVGKRWTILILAELSRGKSQWKRYSQIKKGLRGITPKMLSMRLRELEEDGMIKRRVSTDVFPVRSEYSLTPMGAGLVDVLRGMREWAIKWKVKNVHCDSATCAECEI